MTRQFRLAALGGVALSAAACTTIIGLGPSPVVFEEPDSGPPGDASAAPDGAVEASAPPADAADASAPLADAADAPGEILGTDGGDAAGVVSTLLVSGSRGFELGGITSDGWVLYSDPFYQYDAVFAVPLRGGQPRLVTSQGGGVSVEGNVALVKAGGDGKHAGSTLSTWTSLGGTHSLGNVLTYRTSADGSRIAYSFLDPPTDASAVQMLRFFEAPLDFSSPIALASSAGYDAQIRVAGDRFVLFTTPSADRIVGLGSADSFTSSGASAHLYDGGVADVAGTTVIGYDPSGQLFESAGGATGVALSPPDDAGVTFAELTPDGHRVVFIDSHYRFWVSSDPSSAPSLLPNMMEFLSVVMQMAPDGAHFVYSDRPPHFYVASTSAGNSTALRGAGTNPLQDFLFSTDSRWIALLEGNVLDLAPLDTLSPTPGAAVACADNHQPHCLLAAHDSTFVYGSGGDLWSVDAREPTRPTLLARSAPRFLLDPSGTTVVYRHDDTSPQGQPGLYAVAIP